MHIPTPAETEAEQHARLAEESKSYPGEQYIPSNSSDGSIFLDGYCAECERDKVLNGTVSGDDADPERDFCNIVNRSFCGAAVEWRRHEGKVFCVKFLPMGVRERCDKTVDMFA